MELQYKIAYKMVLSGLQEHSWGCGTFKRTVWHALVSEDFEQGRFKRKKHDFLCSPKSRPFDTGFPSEGRESPRINCKSCQKILDRMKAHQPAPDAEEGK